MTRQKTLKRRVRTRMEKTGERYTTARRHVLGKNGADAAEEDGAAVGAVEQSHTTSTDAAIRATGRPYEEWFALLDASGATERTHTEIARWLREQQDVAGWWAQSITVSYERARGMRASGETAAGFVANVTKTVGVSAERAFEAFADEALREQWLPEAPFSVRTARPGRSVRANWDGGETRVIVAFDAKGEDRCQVAVAHERLADGDALERTKAFWRERLSALKELLEAG